MADDDTLQRAPNHPVTTTLLFVIIAALGCCLYLSVNELSIYVNPDASAELSNYGAMPQDVMPVETEGDDES